MLGIKNWEKCSSFGAMLEDAQTFFIGIDGGMALVFDLAVPALSISPWIAKCTCACPC